MNTKGVLAAAGIGAAMAFMFDPSSGARRRGVVAGSVRRAARATRDGLDAAARDAGNRARGMAASARRPLRRGKVSDVVLIERVRAALGRASSHPRAIDVLAHDGEITLRGPILAAEVDTLLAAAEAVHGVRRVVDELDPHESGDGIPSLQGDGRVITPLVPRRLALGSRALVSASLIAAAACVAAFTQRGHRQHDRLIAAY